MTKGVTFYLMRHGETFFNHYGRVQGWSNSPLTPKGIEQAKASGRGIADIHFDAIYTSDLQRTQETLHHVLSQTKHSYEGKIKAMPELREVSFGSFEGLPSSELFDKVESHLLASGYTSQAEVEMPTLLKIIKHLDPYHHAENYVDFWNRIETGLLILLNKHAGTDQKILIVSHGWTIRNLIHGLVADYEEGEPLLNCSLSIVEYRQGQFRLNAINKVDHFIED
ncbi:histidine phosphatase family protein [Facklamia sp. DSM 111018]|uniref:Histidine phosphatase family protein n=1 Tax=Facklamia lactis TaxID=2749967 RepID=A0ABS0LQH7_9LACT|nr:histidine phosphatase family protein [Facklamia lactis]MBG9979771.1 histidine phosphatase family protein [Facklamia lactis]MBG9985549.1 histidine phosphatase family protein [Facklamia lactis]